MNRFTNFKVLVLAYVAANCKVCMYFVGMVSWIGVATANMEECTTSVASFFFEFTLSSNLGVFAFFHTTTDELHDVFLHSVTVMTKHHYVVVLIDGDTVYPVTVFKNVVSVYFAALRGSAVICTKFKESVVNNVF